MYWHREQWYNICRMITVLKERDWGELSYAWYHLWFDFVYPVYNLWRQTKVICSYIPVLWNDRDWDWVFVLLLLQHKLKRMESKFRNGCHVGCEKTADKMKQCIELIERIVNNDYGQEAKAEFKKKWGELRDNSVLCQDDEFEGQKVYEWDLQYENEKTPEDSKQCYKESLEIYKLEAQQANRDMKLLFYILRRNLKRWWD